MAGRSHHDNRPNCWEFLKCGREPGGEKAEHLGICPAAELSRRDGINGGFKGGRVCWALVGTLCGGKIQGTYAEKMGNCNKCNFYQLVQRQEGVDFRYPLPEKK